MSGISTTEAHSTRRPTQVVTPTFRAVCQPRPSGFEPYSDRPCPQLPTTNNGRTTFIQPIGRAAVVLPYTGAPYCSQRYIIDADEALPTTASIYSAFARSNRHVEALSLVTIFLPHPAYRLDVAFTEVYNPLNLSLFAMHAGEEDSFTPSQFMIQSTGFAFMCVHPTGSHGPSQLECDMFNSPQPDSSDESDSEEYPIPRTTVDEDPEAQADLEVALEYVQQEMSEL